MFWQSQGLLPAILGPALLRYAYQPRPQASKAIEVGCEGCFVDERLSCRSLSSATVLASQAPRWENRGEASRLREERAGHTGGHASWCRGPRRADAPLSSKPKRLTSIIWWTAKTCDKMRWALGFWKRCAAAPLVGSCAFSTSSRRTMLTPALLAAAGMPPPKNMPVGPVHPKFAEALPGDRPRPPAWRAHLAE